MSAQLVYVLAPHIAAAEHAGLRRADPRGLHRAPPDHEHAAARAVEEVESAALRFGGSRERREKLVEALKADEDARNLSLVRYEGGLADFLAVLDAQRQLFAVQDEEIASREQTLLHLVSLYKALGGGWNASRYDAL